ncbi:hypothetical protein [Sulfuriflexus sp.]|uniref:hypothetical protein n=1 Tax=Sulfuriflexus sp. TaxID=2015443 RepID=UPI0028CEA8A8|nr:hypothetical protein [Sulfuriflexus sp.]MDT8404743.1 hypothetical protein [Sulfuriflexus sp.]
MAQAQKICNSDLNHISEQEDSIRNEIHYYSCCLDEIRNSHDPEYRALFPIYESLLAHRQRQLEKLTSFRKVA